MSTYRSNYNLSCRLKSTKSHRERELQSTGCNIGYRSMWRRLVVDHDLVVAKETVRHTQRILDLVGVKTAKASIQRERSEFLMAQ